MSLCTIPYPFVNAFHAYGLVFFLVSTSLFWLKEHISIVFAFNAL